MLSSLCHFVSRWINGCLVAVRWGCWREKVVFIASALLPGSLAAVVMMVVEVKMVAFEELGYP